ncbi:MAG: RNA dependent RNA polymerase [Bacteriophage sp.]|nr:MAG: RNA dependent RNA polymerase [Bacteriophage sp.]
MTRTREDGKEEVFSACIKHDDTRYLGGNKSSSVVATKLQGRPRAEINYDKANEFCANRGDWITMIDYLEYCAIQALCYIEYANNLKRDLRKYPNETKYCLKLDIRKFYPSIPHNGLKKCIRKKIKDKDFLMILDEIIDSTDNVRDVSSKLTNKIGIGVPIGNYLSQYFANLYLINFKITKYDWRIYTKNRKENIKPQI